MTEKQAFWFLITICLGAFMSHFTAGIVNVSLPYLETIFQSPLNSIQWITTSYLLVITALLPIMGKLGDRYGHGLIHNLGYLFFTLSTILIAVSPNVYVLMFFRILQAIGAAMFQATNIALLSFYYGKEQRGRALGIMSSVVAMGAMTGPIAGGLIAEWLSWQWLFLIHLPVAVAAVGLAYRFIPIQRLNYAPKSIDPVGALLFFIVIAAMIYGLSSVNTHGWLSINIILAFITGGIALALFLLRESRQANPFLPIQVLSIPSVSVGLITSFITFFLINTVLVVMPFYLSHMTSYTPLYVGLIITAYPLLFAVTSPVAGYLSDRFNLKLFLFIGLSCIVTGLTIFTYFLVDLSTFSLVTVLALIGIGMGCLAAPNNSYIMREVPLTHAGSIGGLIALTRNGGMFLGAVLGLGMLSGRTGQPPSYTDFGSIFKVSVIMGLLCFAVLGYGVFSERQKKQNDLQLEESS
ncbi:MFS transporter [Paenibacillus paeoniae]|uniref:MFS transporter n=1 Tax=Paenibacillus paeoniae TaxID=2292705 RepID=A0A371PP65_9BACL|nr:MFS transporter [Paenibacillus paeoniae]